MVLGVQDGSPEVDDFGFDARYLDRARLLLDFLYRRWWRVEAVGFEPGIYVSVYDSIESSPYTLKLDDADTKRIAGKLGDEERLAMGEWLVDYGIPGGDSAMARTVSLPCAVATNLSLEGKITTTGLHIPVLPEIYEPVLVELGSRNEKRIEVLDGLDEGDAISAVDLGQT